MRCPTCGSTDTKKVRVTDLDWRAGAQRCRSCGHMGDWGDFCDPPLPKIVPSEGQDGTASLLMT